MNLLRNLIAWWCPTLLLLAAGWAHAETVLWSDNFDTNAASRWSASATGVWNINSPTAGPPLVSGFRTHSGADCAFTGGYAYNKDSRLVCHNYNGASSLAIPSADQYPRLRFYHWFNFVNALGYVEISTNSGGSWTQISPTYLNLNGGGVWTSPSLDLSGFAGQNVLIAFHFTSGCCVGNALGWFVDDVSVVTGTPVLNFPENFAAGLGDWSVDYGTWEVGKPASGPGAALSPATNSAATVLAGNYANNVDSRLISPPFLVPANGSPSLSFSHWYSFNNALGFVELNNGSITVTTVTNTIITTNVSATLNTNIYQLFGSLDSNYAAPLYWNPTIGGWTNAAKALGNVFVQSDVFTGYYFEAGYAPLSSVNAANFDYRAETNAIPQSAVATNFFALQGVTWMNGPTENDSPVGYFATNSITTYTTNTTVSTGQSSWTQISPTYLNATSGAWTSVSTNLSAYAGQTVFIAFHFTSGGVYTAPGWYVDDITLIAPPQLVVPTNQTMYAGQELLAEVYATNGLPADALDTFRLLSPPANVFITNGVVTWQTASNQPSSTNTITVAVTDNNVPPFSATNSFVVTVVNPLVLTVPPTQTIYAGQTLVVTVAASNELSAADTFTYALLPTVITNLDATDLPTDGVLAWPTLTTQRPGTYTIGIQATDDDFPYSTTNSFLVVVSNASPPTLQVPAKQVIYPGLALVVTNFASSIYGASSSFTFQLLSVLQQGMNTSGLTNDGVLSWNVPTNQSLKNYTNTIKVVDRFTALGATNSFVIAVSNAPPPTLMVPGRRVAYPGQSLTVTNSASSVYTNSSFIFQLLSVSQTGMNTSDLTNDGVLSWNIPTNQPAKNYTNTIKVVDSISRLSATNQFVIAVSNAPPPSLTVPLVLTNYAGQTLPVPLTATNNTGLSTANGFTFTLLSPTNDASIVASKSGSVLTWTNTGITNGALTWTNNDVAPGARTISVIVTDDTSSLSATNHFQIVFLAPPSPALTVPATQTIALGQTLALTTSATNSFLPNCIFTFSLAPPSTNATLNASTGVLNWTNAAASPGSNQLGIAVRDNSHPPLMATNTFAIIVLPPPVLRVPPAQTMHAGQTWTATISATNPFSPGALFTFAAPSASTNYWIANTNGVGVFTWTNTFIATNGVLNWTNSVSPGTNAISVSVTESNCPGLSAASNFDLIILPPLPPVLIVPAAQTIYAGETLVVTNYATNTILTNCVFTFATSGPGSLNATNGLLTWVTLITQPTGFFTNIITVMDNSAPPLRATNSLLVQVLPPQPPTLVLPPTQAIYAGQLLVVTNYATNGAYPGSTFTFAAFGPTNLDVSNLPNRGVLKWTPTAAQAQSENTIYVMVTENNSLSANSNFLVLVFPTPSPELTVSPLRPISAANGFQFTVNTFADITWRIDASTNLLTWWPVSTNLASPSGSLQFTDPVATNFLRRFYRAVLP